MSESNIKQVGGAHYKGTALQHWDFVYLALHGRYLEGNITKYVSRHRKKNGKEDLEKAKHYAEKLVEKYRTGEVAAICGPSGDVNYIAIGDFCGVNNFNQHECRIMFLAASWIREECLRKMLVHINALIREYAPEEATSAYVNQN